MRLSLWTILAAWVCFSACTSRETASKPEAISGDFIAQSLSPEERALFLVDPSEDCSEHLKKIVCLSESENFGLDKDCSSEKIPADVVPKLQRMVGLFPPLYQRIFCGLGRLQVHRKIFSIAYASNFQDENFHVIGNMIGIKLEAIAGQTDRFDLFTWKEQLNFGFSKPDDPEFKTSPKGPRVVYRVEGTPFPALLPTLIHEMGHLIDNMNRSSTFYEDCAFSNDELGSNGDDAICPFSREGSFSRISWPPGYFRIDDFLPPISFNFKYPLLSLLCFYDCNPVRLSPSSIHDVYAELRSSPFMTSYSTQHPREDFAEATAIWSMKAAGMPYRYRVTAPDGTVLFDIDKQWDQPQLQAKKKWLADFFARPDLVDHYRPENDSSK